MPKPTAPKPTLKMELASMVEVANLELAAAPAQACEPTRPVVIFKQPSAKVSMRKIEVDATPLTVKAVDDALTKRKLLIDEDALLTIKAPVTDKAVVEA